MFQTIAIVYAPDADKAKMGVLLSKLQAVMHGLGLRAERIHTNLDPEICLEQIERTGAPTGLTIGWGLSMEPFWTPWTQSVKTSTTVRQFIAVDLYDRCGKTGRVIAAPGQLVRNKSWRTNCRLFLNGYHVGYVTPYGMRRVPAMDPFNDGFAGIGRHRLSPGPPLQIRIVRLIFTLFADCGYTLTGISNLLNAQGVEAPHGSRFWDTGKVRAILGSVVYIGTNKYGACLKHGAFPALVDRSIFCAAMARMVSR